MLKISLGTFRSLTVCGIALVAMGVTTLNAQAQTTLGRIISSGKITIGIHNRAPWGFRGADGQATGFHPDLIRAAFTPLGVKEVEFVIADLGALIPGLLADRTDAVASGFSITPARCEQVAFGEPELAIGDAVIVQAGNPHGIHSYADIAKNPKLSIGGSRGSANLANARAAGIPTSQVQQFQNTESSISAIMAGRVHAVAFSSGSAVSLLQDPRVTGLERAVPFQGYIKPDGKPAANYSGIAFRKGDAELKAAYDKRLAELRADGGLVAIAKRYGFTADEIAPDSVKAAELCADKM